MHKGGMNLLGQSRSTGTTKNNIKLQSQEDSSQQQSTIDRKYMKMTKKKDQNIKAILI
jgi:hypothetical protein